jgi:uncharacterized protein YoxC
MNVFSWLLLFAVIGYVGYINSSIRSLKKDVKGLQDSIAALSDKAVKIAEDAKQDGNL